MLSLNNITFISIIILLFFNYSLAQIDRRVIEAQILNTKQLIKLYQSKLQILEKILQSSFNFNTSTQDFNQLSHQNSQENINIELQLRSQFGIQPQYKNIILQKSMFQSKILYLPPKYIISNNNVYSLEGMKLFQFLGDVISTDPHKITTLLNNNRVNIFQFDHNNQKKQQKFLPVVGQRGLKTIWHTSTDYGVQDVLIQIKDKSLIMKNSQNKGNQNILTFNNSIVDIYSLNQYKLLFLTQKSYGIINMRSFTLTIEYNFTKFIEYNVENYQKQNKNISNVFQKQMILQKLLAIASFNIQNHIYILLNDFRLVRYRQSSYTVDKFNINLMEMENNDFEKRYKNGEKKIRLDYEYPHLFLCNEQEANFLVYNVSFSKSFVFWTEMEIPIPFKISPQKDKKNGISYKHQFFKHENTIRLLLTRQSKQELQQSISLSYDLQLSIKKDAQYSITSSYWKVFIVVIIVVGFVLFRYKKTKKQLFMSAEDQRNQKGNSQKNNQNGKGKIKQVQGIAEIQNFIQTKKKSKIVDREQNQQKSMKNKKNQ